MWEPRRLTTLWAFTACYRVTFTFLSFRETGQSLQLISQSIAVTLYTRIWEMLGLNLGQNDGYRDGGFLVAFLTPSREILGQFLDQAMATSLQFHSNFSSSSYYMNAL
jgi:hypothetical protein